MSPRKALSNFFLWWAVIGLSIWVGGTIFSMAVIVPMWSESPPQSVTAFFGGTHFNKYIYNFFGPPWMAIRSLPILISLFLCWNSKYHRRCLLISAITLIFGIVFTLSYVYPINEILMTQAGAGKPADEIRTLAQDWVIADRFRFATMMAGYVSLLLAFRRPIPDTKNSANEIR